MNTGTRTSPDFEELERVIKGEKRPSKVHLVELGMDREVSRFLVENVFDEAWVPDTGRTRTQFAKQHVNVYRRMGYDFAPGWGSFQNMPQFKERKAADTADLSRGERHWVEEGGGIIKNWDDFERIGWDRITPEFGRHEAGCRNNGF